MAHPAIEAALALARERHEALQRGDHDAYEATGAAMAEQADALASAGAEALAPGDLASLDELIALETQSLRLVREILTETSAGLETLNRRRRARGAYGAQERLAVNGR